jgi:hypothetical protein
MDKKVQGESYHFLPLIEFLICDFCRKCDWNKIHYGSIVWGRLCFGEILIMGIFLSVSELCDGIQGMNIYTVLPNCIKL